MTMAVLEPGKTGKLPALSLAPASDVALWRPTSQADLAPPGEKAKARANLAALRVLRALQEEGRTATPGEAADMARWAGWGAIPNIFDEADPKWADERSELRQLLVDEATWNAARATVLNAHYTSADVVLAMWKAVVALGFTGGTVLEPGCGSGNFFGLAPDLPLDFTGVELDPITAQMAAAIYPDVTVRTEGFQDSRFAADSFDLAVGNVPFAKLALADPHHNKARHSIHNHFIIKALHLTRPGGLVVLLTSRYTLDSRNPAARRDIAELADLVGAVRLPEGAFRAAAGTDVVEDLLVLRRRMGAPSLFSTPWASLATLVVEGGTTPTTEVNEYFAANPSHMLGTPTTCQGMYAKNEFTLKADDRPLAAALDSTLGAIALDAQARELCWVAPPKANVKAVPRARSASPARPPAPKPLPTGTWVVEVPPPPRKEGTILATDGPTGFGVIRNGVIVDYDPKPRCDTAELGDLVRLRDVLAGLLDVQATSIDDQSFAGLQSLLGLVYDKYVADHGPINRFKTAATGRRDHICPTCGAEWTTTASQHKAHCPSCWDPYLGEGTEVLRRIRPAMAGFRRTDPDFPSLLALEVFDPDTQTAVKAPIFSTRVVAPRSRRTDAATAQDALSLCLDEYGEVRIDVIAKLLGMEVPDAIGQLGTLVWEDPDSEELMVAARYLSGNVRHKLRRARLAAQRDPRYAGNVAALEAVVPEDLGPTEIDARLGCTWIDPETHKQFMVEVLTAEYPEVHHTELTATWKIAVARWERNTVAMSSTWGTGRCDASALIQFSCNQQPAVVYDTLSDGRTIINHPETMSAREKQEQLEERFGDWVWEDHDRATRLAGIYNERFNSVVPPRFDGSHLTLPGSSTHLTPHPHQLDSIWRIICEPSVGLFHPVGSGKTFVMAAAGCEMRRLGLVRKPVYIVPNHMLEQFCAEFLQHYPLARVLLATKEQTEKTHRKEFVARCAMGDWDAIIITRSAFERIPLSAETKAEFLATKIAALDKAIAQGEVHGSVKRLEQMRQKLEQRHFLLLAEHHKDDGVTFEETGIDYLFGDEAHGWKNMAFATHMRSVGGEGSQRAEDIESKISYIRNRFSERVCTLATATPVANSLAEIFVMQRYLQPEDLMDARIFEFDAWAATFGQTVNQLELSPDGSSYRVGSRFAKFRNVPDLMRIFRRVADVKTPEELNIPGIPGLYGGEAEVIVVPSTDAHKQFMAELAERAEAVRSRSVRPDEDNMLTVSTDGRKAALHLRLVGREPDGTDKVTVTAARIAQIYHETKDLTFLDAAGVAPRKGGFQLVFCDLGTPHGDGRWTVYNELRNQLVAAGLPGDSVRFIHDAGDDRRKAEMFAACRDGRVSVLVASTEKAGVGTNIQTRMVALHHLDCPWRPCDIEQREGRGIRQGNQNTFIRVIRYVTEQTFDTYLWQTVARKAAFIYQVMSGKFKGREVDDLGETALSYAEVKALATGNPLLMEQAHVDTKIAKLVRSRRAHFQDQTRLSRLIVSSGKAMDRCLRDAQAYDVALDARVDVSGDRFFAVIDGVRINARTDAGRAILDALTTGINNATRQGYTIRLGTIAGLTLNATWRQDEYGYSRGNYYGSNTHITLALQGVPESGWVWQRHELASADPLGLVRSIEHRLARFENDRASALADRDRYAGEQAAAELRLGREFPSEMDLIDLTARQEWIGKELARIAEEQRLAKAQKGAAA